MCTRWVCTVESYRSMIFRVPTGVLGVDGAHWGMHRIESELIENS